MAAFAIDSTRERSRRAASERPQVPPFRRSLPNRRNEASREQLIQRIRAEFEELRGLKLTLAQARRLFGLREDVCQRVLNTLVRDGLLRLTPDKLFERRRIDI